MEPKDIKLVSNRKRQILDLLDGKKYIYIPLSKKEMEVMGCTFVKNLIPWAWRIEIA